MTIEEVFPKSPTTQLSFKMDDDKLIVDYWDVKKSLNVDSMKISAFGCKFQVFGAISGFRIEFLNPSAYLRSQVIDMTIEEAFPKNSEDTEVRVVMEEKSVVVYYTNPVFQVKVNPCALLGFKCVYVSEFIKEGIKVTFLNPNEYLKSKAAPESNRVTRWKTVKSQLIQNFDRLQGIYEEVTDNIWKGCKQTPKRFRIKDIYMQDHLFTEVDDWPNRLENYEEMLVNMKSITDEELKTAIYENL